MIKVDILTVGGITIDIMMYTNECEIINNPRDITRSKLIAFEYGAKINTEEVYLTYGGGAFNTVINLANLGLKTAIKAQVGDDSWGKEILQHLKKKKINTSLVDVQNSGHTGNSMIINVGQHNEHVAFLYRGANHIMKVSAKDLQKVKTKWIYLTSMTGSLAKKNINEIFSYIKENRVQISWNPGNEQLSWGYSGLKKYLKSVTIFNVNKDEAIELALSAGYKTTKIKELLKIIKNWGPKIVIITDGPKGASAYDGNKIYAVKALPIKGINTTGAGDSFGSTFVAGYMKGKGVDFSLRAAIINSNYVIQKIGAQIGLKNWSEINKLMKKHGLS